MSRNASLIVLVVFILATSGFSQFGDQKVLDVNVSSSQNKIVVGEPFEIAVILNIEPGIHINSHTPGNDFFIPTVVAFDSLQNVFFSVPVYPKAMLKSFPFSEEKISVYDKQVVIVSRVTTTAEYNTGPMKITGKVSYQGCNDNVCFPPAEKKFAINLTVVPTGTDIEKINQQYFSSVIVDENVEQQEQFLTEDEKRAQQILEHGIIYTIIAFFLIGLALNLTPCVYPVIPLTVSYFGGQNSRSKGSSFISAFFYQIGIAFAFAILGLLSGLAGKQWGFLFQSPWFVIVIATIILAMAASLFGAFEITVPNWLLSSVGKSREGVVGACHSALCCRNNNRTCRTHREAWSGRQGNFIIFCDGIRTWSTLPGFGHIFRFVGEAATVRNVDGLGTQVVCYFINWCGFVFYFTTT